MTSACSLIGEARSVGLKINANKTKDPNLVGYRILPIYINEQIIEGVDELVFLVRCMLLSNVAPKSVPLDEVLEGAEAHSMKPKTMARIILRLGKFYHYQRRNCRCLL